jgi:ABC-type multidrug transport system fused ATPase/permease subunit
MIDSYRKILDLFDRRERRQFHLLLLLIVLMAAFDAVSVGSILPFLVVLGDPATIQGNGVLSFLYRELGFASDRSFTVFLACVVFALVVTGISFRALTFYAITRFTRRRGLTLATRLLSRYLAQPYSWFLGRHSAQLGRKVLSEVIEVVNGSIMSLMRLISHAMMALALIGLLVLVEPVVAVVAALLVSGCYGLVVGFTRPHLNSLGERRLQANRERFQIMQEALGGIKDVKVLGLERAYLERFHGPASRLAEHQATMDLIDDLPRHALEAVVFGGMLLFIISLLVLGRGDIDSIVPVLGVFAFAGARLFPTIQQVYSNFTRLRFSQPSLRSVHADLMQPSAGSLPDDLPPALPLRQSLEARDVTYAYPEAERPALNGLSFLIPARTTVGFVGATGAGKSTAIDVVLGLLRPQGGALLVDGVVVDASNQRGWQRSVGYVPQAIFLVDDTVAANIAFGVERDRIDMEAVRRASRIAQLDAFVAELDGGYDSMVGERGVRLSGGQRQRIGIARALYRDPDILVFDEATSALDNLTERAVMDAVQALGHQKTIIMIAHRLSTVRHCDRIFLLEGGRVAASGTYDELVRTSTHFRALHDATV